MMGTHTATVSGNHSNQDLLECALANHHLFLSQGRQCRWAAAAEATTPASDGLLAVRTKSRFCVVCLSLLALLIGSVVRRPRVLLMTIFRFGSVGYGSRFFLAIMNVVFQHLVLILQDCLISVHTPQTTYTRSSEAR